MSTRSIVAIKNDDGSYDAIYCHFDGYIEGGVGEALHEHHDTDELARALIEDGDHSSIAGGCSPYSERDDEEWDDIKPRHYADEAALNASAPSYGAEFLHIFIDGVWTHKGG